MTVRPSRLQEATALLGPYRAGGTELIRLRRLGRAPGEPVDLRRVLELRDIQWSGDTLRIGALVTLRELAAHDAVRIHYPVLADAARQVANPNVRALATVGGNLLQHTRCDYFSHPDLTCLRTTGPSCPARAGHHERGVLFDTEECVAPHPSTLATVLSCYDTLAHVTGREPLTLAELLTPPGPQAAHALGPGEVMVSVDLPRVHPGERAGYVRVSTRAQSDWPLVEVAVRMTGDAETVEWARVTAGAVAPQPLRLHAVEDVLRGRAPSDEVLRDAAARATDGARPLPGTRYKLRQLQSAVLQALRSAQGRDVPDR
ncbi:FAD binding domain-containing protein [Streptomyces sp. NPDC048312]|uniref:Oxidoreductase n=1 Tax=Streptomyces melanovinaceus TaxID=1182637 RepID=A0A060NSZ0_9ACTN|nr:oxidoreductase [Streptomyces melanovinaceus]BAO84852.1 putative molybdopterin dehydrogenase, FAD-binding protein [Streptomyces melanovinaceus]